MDYLQYLCDADETLKDWIIVLNLIINGLPSIPRSIDKRIYNSRYVLNLIINGLPSIRICQPTYTILSCLSFKPYYKWITFNTKALLVSQ